MFRKMIQSARAGIEQLLRRWSANLSAKWNALSRPGQKWLLALVCLAAGLTCVYIIVDGLLGPGHRLPAMHPITLPRHVIQDPPPHAILHPPDQGEAFLVRVRLFRLYFDSLQKSPEGRQVYDSLAAARPGLLDTLQKLETFYHLK
jgi:hypothetical protein